jgi:hypothetical protein
MIGLKRLLPHTFLIFVTALCAVGVTYAWLGSGLGDMKSVDMAELRGEVGTEAIYWVTGGAILPGKTYSHKVTIKNTSATARTHLRARVAWLFQDALGTQTAVPRGMVKTRLEGDGEWEWVEDRAGTWIGKRRDGGVGGDVMGRAGEDGTGGEETTVTVCLDTDPGLAGYDLADKLLKVRFAVALEGELVYNTLPAIEAWE